VGNEASLTGLFHFDGGFMTVIDDAVLAVNGTLNGSFVTQGATPCSLGAPFQMSQTATSTDVTIAEETISGPATVCVGSSETITTGSSTVGAN